MIYSTSLGALGADAAKIVSTTGGAAAAVVPSVLVGTHVLATASLAVPVIGVAISLVTMAITAWISRVGPKQKVATTAIVNEAEPLLQENLEAFMKSGKTQAEKDMAISNFNNVWSQVVMACNRPELGNPGQNCINDRKRGSTKGYDWFALYLDPILDTPVQVGRFSEQDSEGVIDSVNQFADSILDAGAGIDFGKLVIPVLVLGGLWFASDYF